MDLPDSPDKILHELTEFRNTARSIQKGCKHYADALKEVSTVSDTFTRDINEVVSGFDRSCLLGRHGVYICRTLEAISHSQQKLAERIGSVCESFLDVFFDYDFHEVLELKKRRDKGGVEALQLERQYAATVELTAAKRDLHFLRGLSQVVDAQRTFFQECQRICTTMNSKTAELDNTLGELESKYFGKNWYGGIVQKRPGESLYLELRGGVLRQFKLNKEYSTENDISMLTANVRLPHSPQEEDWKDHFRIEINSAASPKPLTFYTTAEAERSKWVKALQDSIAQELNTISIGKKKTDEPQLTDGRIHDFVMAGSASQAPVEVPLSQLLVGVALTPDMISKIRSCCNNDMCAECGAKDPEWAVINFGILICLECSGVHRSLGTHISRVRSLTLDRWTAETVLLLTQLGNAHHNSVYEAAVPPGTKIGPDAPRAQRSEYIRAKYERRAFTMPLEGAMYLTDQELAQQFFSACLAPGAKGTRDVVQMLAHDFKPNDRMFGGSGPTPAILAVRAGNVMSLEVLLQNGANPLLTDNIGWTAYHYAALYNRPRCLMLLMQTNKLEEVPPTPDSLQPIDIAEWNSSAEALNILRGKRNSGTVDLTTHTVLTDGPWIDDLFTPPLHADVPPQGTIPANSKTSSTSSSGSAPPKVKVSKPPLTQEQIEQQQQLEQQLEQQNQILGQQLEQQLLQQKKRMMLKQLNEEKKAARKLRRSSTADISGLSTSDPAASTATNGLTPLSPSSAAVPTTTPNAGAGAGAAPPPVLTQPPPSKHPSHTTFLSLREGKSRHRRHHTQSSESSSIAPPPLIPPPKPHSQLGAADVPPPDIPAPDVLPPLPDVPAPPPPVDDVPPPPVDSLSS